MTRIAVRHRVLRSSRCDRAGARRRTTIRRGPIRLVVGFGAGGPTDIPARYVADKLGTLLGQRMIVENKTGAAGMLATRDVLAQPADGYNLLLCTHFESINTAVYKNPGFKLADLAPISLVAKYYYGIALSPTRSRRTTSSSSCNTPRRIPARSATPRIGAGSAQEIMARQLEKIAGISMNRIPFRSGPQVMPDLIAGPGLDFYVSPTIGVVPQYQRQAAQDPGDHQPGAAHGAARGADAQGEGHRLRALRLPRHLRRQGHAAADHRPAQHGISSRSWRRRTTAT